MNYRHRLQYYLVKHKQISNQDAKQLIQNGRVTVNGEQVIDNVPLTHYCKVAIDGVRLDQHNPYLYIAFYKPKGVESTLNLKIPGNLQAYITDKIWTNAKAK